MSSTNSVSTGLGILFERPENTEGVNDDTVTQENRVYSAKEPYVDVGVAGYQQADTSHGFATPSNLYMQSDTSLDGIIRQDFDTAPGLQDGRRVVHDGHMPRQLSQASLTVAERPALSRHGTLLSAGATPERNAAELKSILGSSKSRLKPGAALLPVTGQLPNTDRTSLEQAKSHARVEVDIALESNKCVQGGYLHGQVKVRIRRRSKRDPVVLISAGKVRVIGFECISDENDRHPFYQCSSSLSSVTTNSGCLYTSPPDAEGFAPAAEGRHTLPFSMLLPMYTDHGVPKGTSYLQSGIAVRYVAMVSIKVKEGESDKCSIAHFYRDCEIWPRLDPSIVLAPAETPLKASVIKGLFMGGSGKVNLSASLHRLHWIAGQQCCVKVDVLNDTKKTIHSLNLALIRSVIVFRTDRCQTSTTQKQVAESVLEMAQRGTKGHASAKGWWTGVGPGERSDFSHFILLPPDALTVTRSRLLEVDYSIQVTLSAGTLRTADVQVSLPLYIVNFLSIDPPSEFPLNFHLTQDDPTPRSDDLHLDTSTVYGNATRAHGQPSRPSGLFNSYGPNSRTLESVAEADDERLPSPDRGMPPTSSQDESLMLDDPYGGIDYESEEDDCHEGHGEPESCSMYANPNEDLGDLSMYEDDDDEVVQYIPDSNYENAPRFADLYHASVQEDPRQSTVRSRQQGGNVHHGWNLEDQRENSQAVHLPEQPSQSHHLHLRPNSRLPISLDRPGRPRGPSSFSQRVQYKLEAAAANIRTEAACDSTEDTISAVPVSVPTTEDLHPHTFLYPTDHCDRSFEGDTQGSSHGYTQRASSSLPAPLTIPISDSASSLPYRRTDGSDFINNSNGGSRMLPRPPAFANPPLNNQSDSETITNSAIAATASNVVIPASSSSGAFLSRRGDGPSACLPPLEVANSGERCILQNGDATADRTAVRPSISALGAQGAGNASGSTSSVKEKIRELEEKQRLLKLSEPDGFVPFV
ncbi:hypothetical protein Hypma_015810 [Hypsizygus marmoreus]|uniref:Arrestin C-terminal-like domain-containing protein n=1 Tax=Hypsizygus marmoreus TaxID=39966 RepID=A0A369K8Q4_HYPMA|nr:hypothetical protein Hypma_015810 [Hypsizygus marmoreus]